MENGDFPRKWRVCLQIFQACLKIGAFTFGGGYAIVPMLRAEFSEKRGWISDSEIADIFAVASSTPGAIAVNSSFLAGYRAAGALGAASAVLGIVLPSLVTLSVIAAFYDAFAENTYIKGALRGIGAAVVALMAHSVVKMSSSLCKDLPSAAIFAATVALCFFLRNVNPALILLSAGAVGALLKYRAFKRGDDK